MQGSFAVKKNPLEGLKPMEHVLGSEAEFYAQNQTGNLKATTALPTGAEPDLWGNALPWAKPVYGDVKNTAKIPDWNKQNNQMRQIFNAIPNRFHPTTNPTGNPMRIFYRPGIKLPGSKHMMAPEINSGELRLVESTQFVIAPPDTAGQIK
jgi:hypothetical protein